MTLKALVQGLALAITLAGAMAAGSAAHATTTLTETQQSWLMANDSGVKHGIFNPIVGFCGADDCSGTRIGEYRDFFTFTIPTLGSAVASADLILNTGLILLEQSPSITIQFTSTSAQTFAALGGGTVFATETFTADDANQTIDIHLDAAAIAAINAAGGKTFEISGRTTSPFSAASPSTDQLALAGNTPAQLVLTPVPEPATWGLLLMGFSSLGAALRRRRLALAKV
jgi:PEP-CTERM motif